MLYLLLTWFSSILLHCLCISLTFSFAVLEVLVELLIRAHDCFTLSCNMEGISEVLHAARLCNLQLIQTKSYSLMVCVAMVWSRLKAEIRDQFCTDICQFLVKCWPCISEKSLRKLVAVSFGWRVLTCSNSSLFQQRNWQKLIVYNSLWTPATPWITR